MRTRNPLAAPFGHMADLSGHRNFHGPEPRRQQPDPVFPSQPRISKSPPEQGGRTGLGQQSASARLFAGRLVDRRTIALAEELARRWNVPAHHVLLSTGWIRSDDYCRVVAREFDIAFAKDTHTLYGRSDLPAKTRLALKSGLMTGLQNGRINLAITPRALGLFDLNSLVRHAKARRYRVVIATPDVWIKAVINLAGRRFTNNAIYGLMRSYPEFSASSGLSLAQIIFLSTFAAFGAALSVTAPKTLAAVLMACLTLFFLLIASFRVVACLHLLARPRRQRRRAPRFRPKESELPVYTVLVPLFRETEVLPHLIFALKRLNYPALCSIRRKILIADSKAFDHVRAWPSRKLSTL